MPMVGGKEYPYTKKGKAEAKMAAAKSMRKPKKQNWSGVKSQVYGG